MACSQRMFVRSLLYLKQWFFVLILIYLRNGVLRTFSECLHKELRWRKKYIQEVLSYGRL